MEVEVRLFAMLRERAGCDSVTVDVPEGATVRQALDAAGARHGLGELLDAMPVVMAVNRDYATDEVSLHAGDELALIPPVSGGEAAAEEFGNGPGTRTSCGWSEPVPRPPATSTCSAYARSHAEPGLMRFEFQATEQLYNPAGVVQGGFLTAMLDESMGPAALSITRPRPCDPDPRPERQLPAPATAGRLVGEGRVVHWARPSPSWRAASPTMTTKRRARNRDGEGGEAGMSVTAHHVRVTEEPLSVERLAAMVGAPGAGAVVTFQGTTRDVDRLEYEAYREMAEERMARIVAEAVERHGLEGAAAEHRIGTVPLGESSVLVAASAAHRGEAFEGAREIIDRIKAEAPIWKKEVEGTGERWVDGRRPPADSPG